MGRGRPLTNRSNYLVPEAYTVLLSAARHAAFKYRGQDQGDYISIGWLRKVRKVEEVQDQKYLFRGCLQEMRRYWAEEWFKYRFEYPMSDSLEGLQKGEEEEPLTQMMAEEYMAMLSPVDRRLVRMRLWRGLSWKEIGNAFNITKTAAYMRYKRIINQLREKVIV